MIDVLHAFDPSADREWTAARFAEWLRSHEHGDRVLVVTNREPVTHELDPDGHPVPQFASSGVVNALAPLVRGCSATWIAAGTGTADRAVCLERDGLLVDNGGARHRLRRVWLNPLEQAGYYAGCANEALWPLCHDAHVKPVFRPDDFSTYWAVNARFADAVRDEATSASPLVLVQDYHFALLPMILRERVPDSTIVSFWHIPWPAWDRFRICPWREHLIHGLLGSDIAAFQTDADATRFMETVARTLEARVDHEQRTITCKRHRVLVRSYPASIEWPSPWTSGLPSAAACRAAVRRELGLRDGVQLGVGVDRLDYTKGLEEKFLAIEYLLASHAEVAGRFVFVQLAQPSRSSLPGYQALRARVLETVDRVNRCWGTDEYRPIILLEGFHPPTAIYRFFRAADLCYVASLHDGMNLVAKEFISARDDLRGVLVLSAFTGAAHELNAALIVNPYDLDGTARALARALRMPDAQQRDRMRQLRAHVAEFSAHRWAAEMLADAMQLVADRRRRLKSGLAEWPRRVGTVAAS